MTSVTDDLPLAAEFPTAQYEDWRKLVDGVLKGAPFEKLVGKTYDGLKIDPLYQRAKGVAPVAGRPAAAPWQIMQRIDHPDAALANAQALTDLENGATGLALVFAGGTGSHGFGLEPTADTVARVLKDIQLDAGIGIELQVGPQSRLAAIHVAEYVKSTGIDPAACDIRFGLDPLAAGAEWGSSPYTWEEIVPAVTGAIRGLAALGFKGPFASSDGRVIHDAGGSEAQELAFVLACGIAYLRAIEGAGVPLEQAQGMVYARLAADADQFLTMAKFRALRLLWARIEQACGLTPKPLFIAADTAWRMLTQRDPYVNMLRATMATFAAGLAGANAVTVLPYTLALGLPDPFARRIARNTQLLLLEESNLGKVSDPAAGAGGIETLTAQLCEAAWALFQESEKAGGAFAALQQNLFQGKVAAARKAREANIDKRRDVLTGASEFPNLHESVTVVLKATPVALPPYGEQKYKFDALPPIRLAEPFEALRDKSDATLKAHGARPKVFLANLGTPADFTARANFAKSFFEAGGIQGVDSDGFADPAKLAAAFKASGAGLACLCSSDKVYTDQAEAAARALQQAGARHIYLVGRPTDAEAALRAAGIGGFIFAGADALATLQDAYRRMEQR
ncbi:MULTISPECIES: methylmalonyl-CoA mutase family protein [unclassified Bradyrhizobium]|uniref:methylmalonyl-CoA mutase family protein n=1 Tax=unclassified Bradyrhizobium TaxID=2631580 RepID=UPI00247A0D71|nr:MULTISPECIES: methylmalonyl-CoA mutase family protein [unclassified Bradyrhizobium]WGR68989.1 methylmalonyl-CoA mutase subunit beta [Bradyrhizobium sp. ISRA426]WGR81044.1 methylmalonyl-CoA mutase subunit beta [Bradyrhizobium sp. ISRA430]WGR84228.1 methylmalonyl-CoA mutase subunit beta [Bradyrhizobium sp. ISRA432]